MKVADLDIDFAELLDSAASEASSGWAQDFCADLGEKFHRYGDEMFITEAQLAKLREIAKDD